MSPDLDPDTLATTGYDPALADYLAAGPADRDRLIAAHPECAAELLEFRENLGWMRRLVGPTPSCDATLGEAGDGGFEDGNASATDGLATLALDTRVGAGTPASPAGLGDFGDYELLAEVARGAMGVVYKARQRSLDRLVAVKMILSGRLASEEDVGRFRGEARAAADLNHPNIVPVHEVGQCDGRHYYAMSYVDGPGLNGLIRDDDLMEPRAAAQLVGRLADAMHYAHRRGVIHRDLKPANVLMERTEQADAVAIAGAGGLERWRPRIADFGLAKRVNADLDLTGTGQVLGTPTYMAPEQAAGKVDEIGPAADIYALGAILYCLLTGRPPFRSATLADTLHQVMHADPVPPRQVNVSVPRDLETICLKCLQKDQARRYADAGLLAEDLENFSSGAPIAARPVSHMERLIKWVRRQPAVAGLVAACLVAAVATAALGAGVPLYLKTQAAHREAEQLRKRAVAAAAESANFEYLFRNALTERYWREGEIGQAREMLFWGGRYPDRNWEWYYLDRVVNSLPQPSESHVIGRHEGPVLALAPSVSADGFVSVGADGEIREWDADADGGSVLLARLDGRPTAISAATDGSAVAAAISDGKTTRIGVWSVPSGQVVFLRPQSSSVTALALSPDGKRLAVIQVDAVGEGGHLRVWELATGAEVRSLPLAAVVDQVAYSPDGRTIAGTFSGTRSVTLWDLTGQYDPIDIPPVSSTGGGPVSLGFSIDGEYLFTGYGPIVSVVHVKLGTPITSRTGHRGEVRGVALMPDGTRFASFADDGAIKLWDWDPRRRTSPIAVNSGLQLRRVAEGTRPWGGVHIQALLTLGGRDDGGEPPSSLAFSRDGRLLAFGCPDGTIRVFDGRPRQSVDRRVTSLQGSRG